MANTDDQQETLLDRVTAMADEIGLTGSEKSSYIHEHMTRGGYRAVPQYIRNEDGDEDEDESSGGGFFGSGNRSRNRRDAGRDTRQGRSDRGGSRRPPRSRGSDSWYDN